jgi:hypothetical protein
MSKQYNPKLWHLSDDFVDLTLIHEDVGVCLFFKKNKNVVLLFVLLLTKKFIILVYSISKWRSIYSKVRIKEFKCY